MAVLVQPTNGQVSDVSHVNQYAALYRGGIVYDVMHGFGAAGDGVTDDTAVLQAAFAALPNDGTESIFFPAGVYKISDTLDIPLVYGRRIFGAGWLVSSIIMTGSNKPIIRFTAEGTHSVWIEDLQLAYETDQTSAQTDSMGIQFKQAGGAGDGFYFNTIRNVNITGAKIGIGIAGSGTIPIWGTLFDTVWFSKISSSAINLSSPTTGGMPSDVFRNIKIINTNSAVVSDAEAIVLSAVNASFDGLDIEGWYNNIIKSDGGGAVTIRNVHIEHHILNVASPVLFRFADGPATFDSAEVWDISTTSALSQGTIFQAFNAATSLTVSSVTALVPVITGSGYISLFSGSGRIWATGCTAGGSANFGEYLPSGFGVGVYARVTVDGLAPVVDVLPTASVTYRGRRFRVLGTTDVESECSNVASAYAWVTK